MLEDKEDGERPGIDETDPPSSGSVAAGREQAARRPGPEAARSRGRLRVRRGLFLLLPLALIASGYWYVTGGQVMSTDDAYVGADTVGVSTDVAGVVQQIDVTENQRVAEGQPLYRLGELPYRIALRKADAQLGIVKDSLDALRASYRDMEAQVQQARDDVAYFDTEFHRQQGLLTAHVASQSTFSGARRNLDDAQQKLASLTQQLAAIAANLDGRPDSPSEQNPRYLEAVAQRDEAARQLAHTVVRAPFAGVVTEVASIAPGKYLQASATAFYLVASDRVWIDSNPKETQLTYVRPGQPATVTVDAYPGAKWRGVVDSISPAAAQQFSLLPAQNSSGNWVKVVQRIPMRVRVDLSDKSQPPLRAGMSAIVDVDTGRARGLPDFISALFAGSRPKP